MDDLQPALQRIARLTPLAEALACIDRLVGPVAPRLAPLGDGSVGRVLASSVTASGVLPPGPVALRDGFAVKADATLDAGGYAPVPLAEKPWAVEVGDMVPPDADAVAPPDAVELGAVARALAPLAPGDGVLPRGADTVDGEVLRPEGKTLRRTDIVIFTRLGKPKVSIREPLVRLAPVRPGDVILGGIAALIASAVEMEGAVVANPPNNGDLDAALADRHAHAVILVGGSGSGQRDRSVHAVAQRGRIAFHGVAISPGETAAFGMIEQRPVLIVPGRIDAALVVWLTLGCRLLARLGGRTEEERCVTVTLNRKVTSTLGMVEFVPVRREGGGVVPLGSGYLSLQALTQADGLIVVPPDSEGFPAGARVEMRPLP